VSLLAMAWLDLTADSLPGDVYARLYICGNASDGDCAVSILEMLDRKMSSYEGFLAAQPALCVGGEDDEGRERG